MNLYETEEIKECRNTIFLDLFSYIGTGLSSTITQVDNAHGIKISELTQNDLIKLLSKIYLYFLDPTPNNHFQGYAYDFFDERLKQAKTLNPSINLYDYGMTVLQTFLQFVKKLEHFFTSFYHHIILHFKEVKVLKQLEFDECRLFHDIIAEYSE